MTILFNKLLYSTVEPTLGEEKEEPFPLAPDTYKDSQKLYCTQLCLYHNCKFFTYVTKIHPHLSKYSKKAGNCNGAIVFEIDIMKKSYPVNSKFTSLPLSKPKWHFFSGADS